MLDKKCKYCEHYEEISSAYGHCREALESINNEGFPVFVIIVRQDGDAEHCPSFHWDYELDWREYIPEEEWADIESCNRGDIKYKEMAEG